MPGSVTVEYMNPTLAYSQKPLTHLLRNDNGMVVRLTDFGARLMAIELPHSTLGKVNVLLGYPNPEDYFNDEHYHGAIVGRCCNRIAGAAFVLNEQNYQLKANEASNHLHGGPEGFHRKFWQLQDGADEKQVELLLKSEDGDQGYPGTLLCSVKYSLLANNTLQIDFNAHSDQDTLVNLSSHGYFNLAGNGDVCEHEVQIHADAYTPIDDSLLPTGKVASVKGTSFDLRKGLHLTDRLPKNGFDTNFAIPGFGTREMAVVSCKETGISMTLASSQPGCQFYTGDYLALSGVFPAHAGLCLEAQNYPDAINQTNFPSPVLRKGDQYQHTTSYQFHW